MCSSAQPADGDAGRRAPALGGPTAWTVLVVGQFAAVVAVLQRSSLGVAATDALARFGITAATLAAFSVVQLLVYAIMQVPVGVLIDRYGSKRLIVIGSLLGATAQVMFALAQALPLAFAARVVLGVGDALTFISVMRLVPAWFPPRRSGLVTTVAGPFNQLGFIFSAVGFAAVLAALGWTPSFLAASAASVVSAGVVLVLLRDAPHGRRPRVTVGRAFAVAGHDIRAAWTEPGTRLAFWLGFLTLFPAMMFGVMWGYPFLVVGQGLAPGSAGVLMTLLALSGVASGVSVGTFMNRHPYHRSRLAIGLVGLAATVWAAVLLWPGAAPLWLLVVLVLVLPLSGVAAIISFDFARAFNPAARLGSAIGLVNVGAFTGTLLAVLGIGLVLEIATPGDRTDYGLTAFKWAFATQYGLWLVGIVQTLRYRRRTERRLALHDPEALAALRRGVHLPPPP